METITLDGQFGFPVDKVNLVVIPPQVNLEQVMRICEERARKSSMRSTIVDGEIPYSDLSGVPTSRDPHVYIVRTDQTSDSMSDAELVAQLDVFDNVAEFYHEPPNGIHDVQLVVSYGKLRIVD